MLTSTYLDQVDLLLEMLPAINQLPCFALKGGTAINLFLNDMPRLSVDIDLTYLPTEPRDEFLKNITTAMTSLSAKIKASQDVTIKYIKSKESDQITKLLVNNGKAIVKIEPNLIFRGSVFECEIHTLCNKAQSQFLKAMQIKTLSDADIYAGKICAALSRQHPRDLFDIYLLLERQGITEKMRQAFVVYLASSSRPMSELLAPQLYTKDIERIYDQAFKGMTLLKVSCSDLIEARNTLQKTILNILTDNERKFLLSIKLGNPNWSLLPLKGIDKLPSILWKIRNIAVMPISKKQSSADKLKAILGL